MGLILNGTANNIEEGQEIVLHKIENQDWSFNNFDFIVAKNSVFTVEGSYGYWTISYTIKDSVTQEDLSPFLEVVGSDSDLRIQCKTDISVKKLFNISFSIVTGKPATSNQYFTGTMKLIDMGIDGLTYLELSTYDEYGSLYKSNPGYIVGPVYYYSDKDFLKIILNNDTKINGKLIITGSV